MDKSLTTSLILLHITTVPQSLNFFIGQVGYMKDRGFHVHALSSPGEALIQFGHQEQVTVHEVEMPRRITPLKDIAAIFQIWQCLKQIKPHIVHAHTPKGGLLGIISAWLARVPIRIYHIHGLPLMTANGYKRWLLWWSEKVSCLLATQVLCVSNSVRQVVIDKEICPEVKVKVLLQGSINGVDALGRFNPTHIPNNTYSEICNRYGIPIDAIVLGFVGRIVRDKGIEDLVAAWKALREEFPNLHLLVVGSSEPQDPISRETDLILKNDSRIHLTGDVQNPSFFYAVMDIFTLPSYREGLSTVLLEAAAMNLPTITTSVPGCIDTVQDGVTGILVPPCNAEALTKAMQIYLQDPELRIQHGKAGRDRVLRDFNQEAIWEAIYQEYLQLLKTKRLVVNHPELNVQELVP